jgi:hypothetical protein
MSPGRAHKVSAAVRARRAPPSGAGHRNVRVNGAPPHTPPGYSPLIEAWATRPDAAYAWSP